MQRRMWWVAGAAGIWVIIIGVLQYLKYQSFAYNGLDLGIYSQVLWSLSHGHGWASSIHDPSYLGDHLELWLIPLSGLYRLWANPLTALWVQTIVLAITVFPLARVTEKMIGKKHVLIVTALFLVHPLLYNAALYEFHAIVFALPISVWMISSYLDRKYVSWVLGAIGLLLVREDMPLLVAGWAVYAAIEKRNWRWWIIPFVVAIGYFFTAQAIIHAANPLGDYKYLAFYRWLGDTPQQMLVFPFRHPLLFLGHFFSAQNWQTVIAFLITFGMLPLAGLRRLWPAIFLFVQLLLLGAAADLILRLHYVIPYIPFLLWASMEGWRRLQIGQAWPKLDPTLRQIGIGVLVIVGPLYGHLLYGPAEWPWPSNHFVSQTSKQILQSAVDSIKPDERVLTTFNLLPALSGRQHIYSLNYIHLGRRQYTEELYQLPTGIDVAVIDWQQYYDYQFLYRDTEFEGLDGHERLEQVLMRNNLRLERWVDNVAVYSRAGKMPYQPTEIFHWEPQSQPPKFRLLESSVEQDGGEILVRAKWHNDQTREQPLSVRWTVSDGSKRWESIRILGQGFESEYWTPTGVYQTIYRLKPPFAISSKTKVSVEVLLLEGRMRLDRWRSFTPRISAAKEILRADLGQIAL